MRPPAVLFLLSLWFQPGTVHFTGATPHGDVAWIAIASDGSGRFERKTDHSGNGIVPLHVRDINPRAPRPSPLLLRHRSRHRRARPFRDRRTRGRISGTLVTPTGAPIPDTEITIESEEGDVAAIVRSDAEGRWATGGLARGVYVARVGGRRYDGRPVTVNAPGEVTGVEIVH